MKKLIILLLILVSISAFGQNDGSVTIPSNADTTTTGFALKASLKPYLTKAQSISIFAPLTSPILKGVLLKPTVTTSTFSAATNLTGLTATVATLNSIPSSGTDLLLAAMQAAGSPAKAYPVGGGLGQNNTATLTNGKCYYVPVWIATPQTITGIKTALSTNGAYTGNNFNGVGLCTLSAGTLTNVAGSTNTAAQWSGGTGLVTIPFTTPYVAVAGLYYVQLIYSSSAQTTAPIMNAYTVDNFQNLFFGGNTFIGYKAGVTSLPSTQALSGLTSLANMPYVILY